MPAEPPNILLILADDMGYGDLGCYGSTQIPTPNIDSLAELGVRCTQGYISAPVCAPSRAGLLTGRYQNRFGFEHNLSTPDHVKPEYVGLPLDELTVADRLQSAGYFTALIGKWHLGEAVPSQWPSARGFDSFFGMHNGSHPYFPTPERHHLYRNGEPITRVETPYLTDWFTNEAIEVMTNDHDDRPWFVFLSYNTPHTPLQAKTEDIDRFESVNGEKRRIYCAMQYCMDVNVGRILESLRETNQIDNTLIVFLSDNGGSCDASYAINAPLRGQKSTFLEGGIRTPFILHWPAGLPRSTVYEQPVSALDLTATFLAAAAGADSRLDTNSADESATREEQPIIDSVNLLPYLRGDRPGERPHETLYWRMTLRGAAIRDGDWKLIRLPHRPPMLFDVVNDISERNDCADDRPALVEQLLKKLHDWEQTFEANPMWISGNNWARYNRRLYDRDYQLDQPE